MANNHWSSPTLEAHSQMDVRLKGIAGGKEVFSVIFDHMPEGLTDCRVDVMNIHLLFSTWP